MTTRKTHQKSPEAPLLCALDSALTDHAVHALRWIVYGAGRHRCSLSVYASAHYALDSLQGKPPPVGSSALLGVHDRQKVIDALFDEMTSSSFAEGCEERIARGLEARTDAQLLELAKSKMTWTPT